MKKLLSLMLVFMLAFSAPAASFASDEESVTLAEFMEEYGGGETQPEVVESETLPEPDIAEAELLEVLPEVLPEELPEVPGGASYLTEGDFEYTADGVLTAYTGSGSVMNIPETLGGVTITTVGDGTTSLLAANVVNEVIIPATVTAIADRALSHNNRYSESALQKVTISGSGLLSIGDYAFENQINLEEINLPDTVTSIGDVAFFACEALTSIEFPNSLKALGTGAFGGTSGLASLTIPPGIETFGYAVFNNSGITSATVNNSAFGSSDSMFVQCNNLTTVILGDEVVKIGINAFYMCSLLENVTFGRNVEEIGENAFYWCTSLESVELNDSLKIIGYRAFHNCNALTDVGFGSGLVEIAGEAFTSCHALTEVVLGDSVTSIGVSAFSSCSALESVTLGTGLTTIGDYAFINCPEIKFITVPDNVTSIGYGAFVADPSITIYGNEGSFVASHADANGYNFIYDEADAYTVNFSADDETEGSVKTDVTGLGQAAPPVHIADGTPVQGGREIVFTGVPQTDFHTHKWTLNGEVVLTNEEAYTLADLSEDVTMEVEFEGNEITTYPITFETVNDYGTLSAWSEYTQLVSPADVREGRDVDFTATANNGYAVKEWKVNGAVVAGNTTAYYKLVNVYEETLVTVEFAADPFEVAFSVVGGNGTLTATVDGAAVNSPASVLVGKDVVFTAAPAEGYRVKEWKLNTAVQTGEKSNTYTLADVQADANVTVEFEPLPDVEVTFGVNGGNGTLTAKVNDVAVESPAIVKNGADVVFTAAPAANYKVKAWQVDGETVANETGVTFTLEDVTEDTAVTVEFTLITYAVTFGVTGGNGTLTAAVVGKAIVSPADVNIGSDVVFTAAPASGYRVKEWKSGNAVVAGNKTNTYTLEDISEAVTVTVEFEHITYGITFSVAGGNGTLTAAVDGAAITSPAEVIIGKDVVFTAVPAGGWRVKEWKSGGAVVAGNKTNTYTLEEVSEATAVTVEFELITYAVTFSVVGENGTLTAAVDGKAIESQALVNEGKDVVFTAAPAVGYRVKEWKSGGVIVAGNKTNTYTLEDLSKATAVTVEFELITHEVTFSVVGANGTLTAAVDGEAAEKSPVKVIPGKDVVFTAVPASGYRVKEWKSGGEVVAGNKTNTYTLEDVSEAVTVTVEFEQITYAVTFSVTGENGTLTAAVDGKAITSPAEVVIGKDVVFTAVPASGYQVKEWKSGGEVVDGNLTNAYTLEDVSAATAVTVEFEEIPVEIKNGFHEDQKDWWYYYIDGVKQFTEGGFFPVDDVLRYFRVGGLLGYGFEKTTDGSWVYILDGAIPAEPGFYEFDDGYWRAIGENGLMLVEGIYDYDGLYRYVMDGAIVAPIGWYDDLNGERRYVADGGILLSPGWHIIDDEEHYLLDGSIPATGEMEIDGVTYIFDEYGRPVTEE